MDFPRNSADMRRAASLARRAKIRGTYGDALRSLQEEFLDEVAREAERTLEIQSCHQIKVTRRPNECHLTALFYGVGASSKGDRISLLYKWDSPLVISAEIVRPSEKRRGQVQVSRLSARAVAEEFILASRQGIL